MPPTPAWVMRCLTGWALLVLALPAFAGERLYGPGPAIPPRRYPFSYYGPAARYPFGYPYGFRPAPPTSGWIGGRPYAFSWYSARRPWGWYGWQGWDGGWMMGSPVLLVPLESGPYLAPSAAAAYSLGYGYPPTGW